MLLAALFTLTAVSSCDPDDVTEWELEGKWYGDFAMYISDGPYSEKAVETTLYFRDNGDGYQYDNYNGKIDTNTFTWDVEHGDIIMTYYGNGTMSGMKVVIYDYTLHTDEYGYTYWEGIVDGSEFYMYKDADAWRAKKQNKVNKNLE